MVENEGLLSTHFARVKETSVRREGSVYVLLTSWVLVELSKIVEAVDKGLVALYDPEDVGDGPNHILNVQENIIAKVLAVWIPHKTVNVLSLESLQLEGHLLVEESIKLEG